MEQTVHFWHYGIMITAFAVMGVLVHIGRAVFNLYPDRLTDSKEMDVMISPGYTLSDYFFDLEFDENGFYELYSLKNLRFCIVCGIICGIVFVIGVPETNKMVAGWIDAVLKYTGELFIYRIHHIRWY